MSEANGQTPYPQGNQALHGNAAGGALNKDPSAMSHEEHEAAKAAARFGYGPLAHVSTQQGTHAAFGGEFQPGTFANVAERKFANPAPLGLSAFALTTFLLSLINLQTRGVATPSIVIASAFAYGGLVQLLAGMWEMAVGNTFGATALSSYGGFWIAVGITLTPGGFAIESAYTGVTFYYAFGFFLFGWFIFTFLLLIATLRSTVAFFFLFFTLDMAFLLLALGYIYATTAGPRVALIKAGGVFGLLAAFAAWYNALAGILDDSNSFFVIPVAHFPWSVKGKEQRAANSGFNTKQA